MAKSTYKTFKGTDTYQHKTVEELKDMTWVKREWFSRKGLKKLTRVSKTDRNRKLVPGSWSLVSVRAMTTLTGLTADRQYSEHLGVCRRMQVPGRIGKRFLTSSQSWQSYQGDKSAEESSKRKKIPAKCIATIASKQATRVQHINQVSYHLEAQMACTPLQISTEGTWLQQITSSMVKVYLHICHARVCQSLKRLSITLWNESKLLFKPATVTF